MEIYGMTGERLGLIGSLRPHPSNPEDPNKPVSPPSIPGPSLSPFEEPTLIMQPPPSKKVKKGDDQEGGEGKSPEEELEDKGMDREEVEMRLGGMEKWKRDFLSKPSLSVRKGIAWGYSPPYEDTSTLVLTAPSSRFVDVRFPLRPDPKQPLSSHPSFWAFTGTAATSFLEPDPHPLPNNMGVSMPYSAHCVWKHDIDSKGPGIVDEGDMFILANGDCMEVGMMQRPGKDGKVEMYKEYWTSAEDRDGNVADKKPCVVAETVIDTPGHNETGMEVRKGLIIRVGNHCQGIALVNQSDGSEILFVERWVKSSPVERNPAIEDSMASDQGDADSSGWLKDWRSNTDSQEQIDVVLPCMWVCGDGRALGDEIFVKGVKWKISELER